MAKEQTGWALVVTADRRLAADLDALFAGEGISAVLCRDGLAARGVITTRGLPNVAVVDLVLPKVDGFSLASELGRLGAGRLRLFGISEVKELRDAAYAARKSIGLDAVLAPSAGMVALREAIQRGLGGRPLPHTHVPEDPTRAARVAEEVRRLGISDRPEAVAPSVRALLLEAHRHFGKTCTALTLPHREEVYVHAAVGAISTLMEGASLPGADWLAPRVLAAGGPVHVADLSKSPVFGALPAVGGGEWKGYLGVPVRTFRGEVVGVLELLSAEALDAAPEDFDQLQLFAGRIAGGFELDSASAHADEEGKKIAEQLGCDAAAGAALHAIFDSLEDGALLVGAAGGVVYANGALARLSGVPREKIQNQDVNGWALLLGAQTDRPREVIELTRALDRRPFAAVDEIELTRPVRRRLRVSTRPLPLPPSQGQLVLYADVTAERELRREREELSYVDALTGLPNRRAGEDALVRAVARAEREGSKLALAWFDLDLFGPINDGFGAVTGDRVIVAAANAVRELIRVSDHALRWGGDEFLVLLAGNDLEGARLFAERVRKAVQALTFESLLNVTTSAGVASLEPGEALQMLLTRAERAVAKAKKEGRNRVAVG